MDHNRLVERAEATFARAQRAAGLARAHGARAVAQRLLGDVMTRLGPAVELEVADSTVLARQVTATPQPRPDASRLEIGWVLTPPSAGSGGHTTILRLVQALEQHGHSCTLYLSQPRGAGDLKVHRRVFEEHFPRVNAQLLDAGDGFKETDVLVATGWPSAYVVRSADLCTHRAYLVQDYEPWFYPAGSRAALAEATYGFGFHGITCGSWLAQRLTSEFGMSCDAFGFGVDERYRLFDPPEARDGIVFYVRTSTPRRAFELGVMALTVVAERHPELTIHLFGERIRRPLPFPYVDHGVLSVPDLNRLYNRAWAGLVLSMSNLSLLPPELLAAGCIPVVNDADHNRGVFDNEWIRWAAPGPVALAQAMCSAVEGASPETPFKAAASVAGAGWGSATDAVEAALLRIVRG